MEETGTAKSPPGAGTPGAAPPGAGPEGPGTRRGRGCWTGLAVVAGAGWLALRVAPWVHEHRNGLVALLAGLAVLSVGTWMAWRAWSEEHGKRAFEREHGQHMTGVKQALDKAENDYKDWERAVEDLERKAAEAEREVSDEEKKGRS